MIRRPPRSTLSSSSAASDVYKRQATIARDVDFYFFDELTPYLDIYQRVNVAHLIRELAKRKTVLVVEHDLAILILLADVVHIAYGEPGTYGVITNPKAVRVGINEYLTG